MFRLSSSIVRICWGVGLFSLGRGLGPDIFFSVYINQILNNHIFLVGIVAAIMPLIKMIASLFIGEIDDHANLKTMIYLSKMTYAICGILFFIAGRLHQPRILILAISINGIASASLFTTYETHIRASSKKQESAYNFGRYLSFFHSAHVIGGILCALFITKLNSYTGLKPIFLRITICSIASLYIDKSLSPVHDSKRSIINTIKRISFSSKTFIHAWETLKESSSLTRFFLILEFIYNVLNYISFLFIPLLASQRNMGLGEIAILYAIMRAPYILSIVLAGFWERYPQKTSTLIVYTFLAIFCFGLGFTEKANSIFIWTIGLSFGLAFIRPMILSGISTELNKQKLGSISGIQQGVGMFGCVAGSTGFAALSSIFGMSTTFSIVGTLVLISIIRLAIHRNTLFKKTPPTNEEKLNSPYASS